MRTRSMWQVLEAIAAEREEQDKRWRSQWKPGGVSAETKLAILGEEFGEACREALENGETSHLRYELIQCAACCVAFAESIEPVDQANAGDWGEMEI